MNNIQQILLGKIPLLISDFYQFETYKETVIKTCLLNEKKNLVESNVAVNSKKNLWESDFTFLEKFNVLNDLKMWLITESETLVNNFNNTNYKFVITESWAHVTRKGGYHKPHYHPNSTWSGIFYICIEEGCEGNNNWYLPYFIERKPGLEFAEDRFTSTFVPGRLILFPSMLLHDAEPYYGNLPRIVIGFNAICL